MRRSHWAAAAVAAAVGWVPAAGAAPPAPTPGQTILLRTEGGSDRTCVLERTYRRDDGRLAHVLRVAATGELLTILDERAGSGISSTVRMSGNGMEGPPQPPASATLVAVQGMDEAKPAAVAAAPAVTAPVAPASASQPAAGNFVMPAVSGSPVVAPPAPTPAPEPRPAPAPVAAPKPAVAAASVPTPEKPKAPEVRLPTTAELAGAALSKREAQPTRSGGLFGWWRKETPAPANLSVLKPPAPEPPAPRLTPTPAPAPAMPAAPAPTQAAAPIKPVPAPAAPPAPPMPAREAVNKHAQAERPAPVKPVPAAPVAVKPAPAPTPVSVKPAVATQAPPMAHPEAPPVAPASLSMPSEPGMARVVGPEMPPAPAPRAALPPARPAAPPAAPEDAFVAHWSHLLREALGPSEREQAAQALTNGPKQAYAESVALLMDSAEHDPAATVRAACVRCLVRMNAKTPAAAELVQRLKSDPDPRVRSEAEWALSVLGR